MSDFENKDLNQEPATPAQPAPAASEPQPPEPAPAPAAVEPAAPAGEGAPPVPAAPVDEKPVPQLTLEPDPAPPTITFPEPPRAPEPPPQPVVQQAPQYNNQYNYGGQPQQGYQPPQYTQSQAYHGYQAPNYTAQSYQQPQAPVQPQYTEPPAGYQQRSRLAAGLLAIIFGCFGIHNFYMGFNTRGPIQLVLCLAGGLITCGVASVAAVIWGFIEGVMLLSANGPKFDGNNVILRP